MTTNELLTLVLSGLSLVVSLVALNRSSKQGDKANDIAGQGLLLNHAQVEIDLRGLVTAAKTKIEEFTIEHQDFLARDKAKLSSEDRDKRKRLEELGASAIEGYLNALDDACQKFLDGKVDVVRFKKAYQREIRQAVQNETYSDYFKKGHSYHALEKVYDTWENQEK